MDLTGHHDGRRPRRPRRAGGTAGHPDLGHRRPAVGAGRAPVTSTVDGHGARGRCRPRAAPGTWPCTRLDTTSTGAAARSETGRHGPTGAGITAHPAWRPSSVVRNHRRFWLDTPRTFHRGRGRRCARTGVSAANRMHSSLSAPERGDRQAMGGEHRLGVEEVPAVEPHVGQRGQPLERRTHPSGRRRSPGPGERGPVPPVLAVEPVRAGLGRPHGLQRGRHGARDLGGASSAGPRLRRSSGPTGPRAARRRRPRSAPASRSPGVRSAPIAGLQHPHGAVPVRRHLAEHAVEVDVAARAPPGPWRTGGAWPPRPPPGTPRPPPRCPGRRAVQPVDEGGGQLGAGAALPAQAERVEVEGLEVLGRPARAGRHAAGPPSGSRDCPPAGGPRWSRVRPTTRPTRSGSSRRTRSSRMRST